MIYGRSEQPVILVYRANECGAYVKVLEEMGLEVRSAESVEEAREKLPGTEILFCWKFPLELLQAVDVSDLRWIQVMGAGVDDVVSSEFVPDSIRIARVEGQFGAPMAEYVFGCLLAETLQISRLREQQTMKVWEPYTPELLASKTMGVAGLGSIGKDVVRKARAFDMRVYGLSLSGRGANLVDRHFFADDWMEFVRDLDYLVLTLPLTDATRHVVNGGVLGAMREVATLVNVGRGALVDETALVEALAHGGIRSAILDVFEQEPLPMPSPLWSMDNVLVTPHMSGPSTADGVCRYFVDNLARDMRGEALVGEVDRRRGY